MQDSKKVILRHSLFKDFGSFFCCWRSAFGWLTKSLVLVSMMSSIQVSSQSISPELLAEIETLPRSEQVVLAQRYGFDLDKVLGGERDKASGQEIGVPGQVLEAISDKDDELEREQREYELFQEAFAEFQQNQQEKDTALKRYGVALFDREVSTFAPTDDATVPGDYRLGAGDHLTIDLFGTENNHYDLQVTRDGEINIPKLGPILVAGLTFEDAREFIRSRVAEELLGAQASVSMGRLRAINIFLAGEVAVPGAYSVSALTTISQALFQVGGISDIGSLRNIQVKRHGKVAQIFDTYSLLLQGDSSNDIRLRSGDVVFVPPYSGAVTVTGAVKRPMIYEYIQGESIRDAITMAGELTPDAYPSGISVVSKALGKSLPEVKNIDLDLATSASYPLQDGDLITVPISTDNLKNAVTIEGAVVRPGIYGWVEGQRISDLLSSVDGDLKIYADLGYGLIVRQKNQRLDIEVLQVDLAAAILNKGSSEDVLTKPRDKILVFGLAKVTDLSSVDSETALDQMQISSEDGMLDLEEEELSDIEKEVASVQRDVLLAPVISKLQSQARAGEPVKTASISGAVKSPGIFPVTTNFTVKKLIAAAGGLEDRVYMDSAELRSLFANPDNEILSRYTEIDLSAETDERAATKVESRDHLHVRAVARWNPDESVVLSGEIRFPGTYRIQKGESLSNVLNRAGGLTEDAFPIGTVFTRESIAKMETQRAREFAQSIIRDFAASQLTKEDKDIDIIEVSSVAEKLDEFTGSGRLLVDIEAAISGDQLADIRLEDGDNIIIPQRVSTVTVVGEIRRPGTHSYQKDLDLNDYIGLSAGMTARADNKELYIVRADGSVLRPESSWVRYTAEASLRPGDTIVVPIDSDYTNNIKLWREITQIVFNSTSGLAAIAAATR